MTLLLTEIHAYRDLRNSVIVFAADSRLTFLGKYFSNANKIFKIEYLNAGIGYFGLAEYKSNNKNNSISNILKRFISSQHHLRTLAAFSEALKNELNLRIPVEIRKKNKSGFHIAGFNTEGLPEFWFIQNISADDNPRENYECAEQYLKQYALEYGYDGHNPILSNTNVHILTLRNGDYRAHELAWKDIDNIMKKFLSFPDFKKLTTIKDYEKYVKFKLSIISYIYKKYCKNPIIGTPVEVFSITNNKTSNKNNSN